MSLLMPENEEEMLKIDGVTKSNFEKFGEPLLEITRQAAIEKSGKNRKYPIIIILPMSICYCIFLFLNARL